MVRFSLAQLSADLATGRTTSRALTEGCLAAIADPKGEGGRAFVHVDPDRALSAADASDRRRREGRALSPLDGLVISIKDLFDVEGQTTRAGSVLLTGDAPARRDADAVARLRAAGMVLIGRTNMTEFAFSGLGLNPHYGTPLSRWRRDEGRIAGGSTSGGATSVADGMAHATLGTDTGGSCRIPAAFNGLTGFKPTAGRVSTRGAIPLSTSLDTVGTIAPTVRCCEMLDDVLSGQRPQTGPLNIRDLKIAVPSHYVFDGIEPLVAERVQHSLSTLSEAGAVVEYIAVPEFDGIAELLVRGGLVAAESYAWHRDKILSHESEYDPRVAIRIKRGSEQAEADYSTVVGLRREFIARVAERLAPYDIIAMPTTPILPPLLSALEDEIEYSRINLLVLRNPTVVNLFDGCAISLPIGGDFDGPPVGLTLAAPGREDARLLAAAAAVEPLVRSIAPPRSASRPHQQAMDVF
jgi:aspartyl-tRNA(Asn)/glutamyl-tRNA(Gln) amidotransferase subunit A